eukprot:TRINITY_DN91524_c0_g1_i1.p1 TRINITY_DN91524_c0_g1~~TRINITY_DN91524_c0_g1_i1.p1  ORF type:complete len:357 (+),score=74.28 TRINITY_DN91524_c0_g1_i1:118-1188(+)
MRMPLRRCLLLSSIAVLGAEQCDGDDEVCHAIGNRTDSEEADDLKVSLLQRQRRRESESEELEESAELLEKKAKLMMELADIEGELASGHRDNSSYVADLLQAESNTSDQCRDTPSWSNGYAGCISEDHNPLHCSSAGWTCSGYEAKGWCSGGRIHFGQGGAFHNPERNCCQCGGGHHGPPGSCAKYGCGRYSRSQDCQCNSKCAAYQSCCDDYRSKCLTEIKPGAGKIKIGYHQTSPEICRLILQSEFKRGHGGWCGDGIYFAMTPEATRTKAITENSHEGCMIEARVDIGRLMHFPCCRKCKDVGTLERQGYDSVIFNPGDGEELVIYDAKRVVSMRTIPYKKAWEVEHRRRRR